MFGPGEHAVLSRSPEGPALRGSELVQCPERVERI